MIKLLPIVVIISAIIGVGIYFGFYKNSGEDLPAKALNEVPKTLPQEESSKSATQTFKQLVDKVTSKANKASPTPSSDSSMEARIKILESTVANLEQLIKTQKLTTTQTTATTTTSSSTDKTPIYIFPLGGAGSTTATDWTTNSNLEFIIEPADYSGYSSMVLEVELKVHQGNGKAYARLINYTDSAVIFSSEVSTIAENYTWVNSSSFTISGSKKTYRLQLKSLTGYEAFFQNARIKVNF